MYIPLLSSTLPEPRPGPHATGYTLVRLPAEHYADTPKLADGTPALSLTESVLAIYYPTAPARVHGVPWSPEPLAGQLRGYLTYGRRELGSWGAWIGHKVLGRIHMPVHPDAPPAEGRFPLVIFSHGLVGTRNTYSHFCSSLASEGYVVVAVEHADGSSPCVVRDGKEKVFTRLGDTE
jgi:platelet-activating factor acetylhydrolase